MSYYLLSLNAEQAQTTVNALDFYARILAGQLDELGFIFRIKRAHKEIDFEKLNSLVKELKETVFPELNQNSSSHNNDVECWRAFDVKQTIRHTLAWDRDPDGGITVDFDEPMKFGDQQLPVMLKIKNGEIDRVKDQLNKRYYLTDQWQQLFNTSDIQDAYKTVKKWKKAYDELNKS